MTMNYYSRPAASIFLVHPLARSKFACAMHLVAGPDGYGVQDTGKTSEYATAQHKIHQFTHIRHASPSGLDPLLFLPESNQST
jgi:hypothetical protein